MTVALGWACSSASAFTFDMTAGHVVVLAAPGEVNALSVEDLAGGVIVTDLAQNPVTSAPPAAALPCKDDRLLRGWDSGRSRRESLAMSKLMDHAAVALDELMQRVPKIVARDAPQPSAYALAIWFEWSRGDWFRWLPMLTVMQQRRIDAGLRLGVDPRVGFWDPWGVPAEAWAGRNEISHGTADVIAGVAGDLSVSPRAARVFEPLQDAWLDVDEPTADGLLFEEWFGI